MECSNCDSTELRWFTSVRGNDYVCDGLHKTNEMQVLAVLGCEECSETLAIIPIDKLLANMTQADHDAVTRFATRSRVPAVN